jgi:hypothetical protein
MLPILRKGGGVKLKQLQDERHRLIVVLLRLCTKLDAIHMDESYPKYADELAIAWLLLESFGHKRLG